MSPTAPTSLAADALAAALQQHPLDGVVVLEAVRDGVGRPVDMRIVYVNGTGLRSAGREITGMTMFEAYGTDSVLVPMMFDILGTGRITATDVSYDGDAGDAALHHRTFTALLTSVGPDVVVAQYRDVSAERELVRRLEHLAGHDELTGLPNRRLAYEHLGRALARRRGPGDPGVLVLIGDLDGFKQVNDTLGHAAGDVVLREVAAQLRAAARPDDVVARLGGDEFLVMCESVAEADVDGVVRRVRDAVVATGVGSDLGAPVTLSVGWAWTDELTAPDDLVVRADAVLYQEKARRAQRP